MAKSTMTDTLYRLGEHIPADEVFNAWTSGQLKRMLKATSKKTNSVDRHFLLMGICKETYKRRKEPEYKALFLQYARLHIGEYPDLSPDLKIQHDGMVLGTPTFQNLSTVLAEEGHFDEAIKVCKLAMAYGLEDGTKSGFEGRIKRIEKKRLATVQSSS